MFTFSEYSKNSKPYTRWWWFSGKVRKNDIAFQLDWIKKNGFGGVEIAWVYPLPGSPAGPAWLSKDWSRLVAYAKRQASTRGLGCDFTFGTLWPFGGSIVPECDAARTYRGLSKQRLHRSWESAHARPGFILDHLNRNALSRYARIMTAALKPALAGRTSALFCDSWEVATDGLWTKGFRDRFRQAYGYDALPFMPKIDKFPDVRYDYRKLVARCVLDEFYRPFARTCRRNGALSRVQCHGAPTDLIAAYAAVDVPESEAILFDPAFSKFAASAAVLAGKKTVSAETFTCLYGWKPYPGPGPYHKRERISDLKLLADAMFANGINFIVWHGMPFNPRSGNNSFYATVHVGPDSAFALHIRPFNRYLQDVSGLMRRGKTYTDIAVYLPLEDAWMKNELPGKVQKISSRYHWELQETKMPGELKGFNPLWVSRYFLARARFDRGRLRCGRASFALLYVDVEFLDLDALRHVLRLARRGCPVCLKRIPRQPGRARSPAYGRLMNELLSRGSVKSGLGKLPCPPRLVEGRQIPDFWVRRLKDRLLFFFAHPLSKDLAYPLPYKRTLDRKTRSVSLSINCGATRRRVTLRFLPYRSIALTIDGKGRITAGALHRRQAWLRNALSADVVSRRS